MYLVIDQYGDVVTGSTSFNHCIIAFRSWLESNSNSPFISPEDAGTYRKAAQALLTMSTDKLPRKFQAGTYTFTIAKYTELS